MDASRNTSGPSASERISKRIADLGGWRGETLSRVRQLIKKAVPNVVEEWKWMGTPVWSLDGIICTGESYKKVVKLTFAKGAALKDPTGLFNSSLDGNVRRAIDIPEGVEVNESAFIALVREAVALNRAAKKKPAKKTTAKKTPAEKTPAEKTPAKKTPAKKTPAKKTSTKKTSTKKEGTRDISQSALSSC